MDKISFGPWGKERKEYETIIDYREAQIKIKKQRHSYAKSYKNIVFESTNTSICSIPVRVTPRSKARPTKRRFGLTSVKFN
jgi:hypothetical protein